MGGYASGDARSFSVADGKARCTELGSNCSGLTCTSSDNCSVRQGPDLKASNSGERTYTYECGESSNLQ